MDKVIIFDTTLRDGEQAAGGTLNVQEKLDIARALEKLNVDVIEAGFPASSRGDFEAVTSIGNVIKNSGVCGLTRAIPAEVDRTWEAVKVAAHPRIHIFLSSSDIHIQHQLKKSREEIIEMACAAVKQATKYTADVEFSPMDASRTEPKFLYQILEAVIAAGATTVNIPDTVGYAVPQEFGGLIESICKTVPNISQAVVSVHCHNDLGIAVANSLEAVRRGARQIECTINGIGERAGNASLEEIVMNIKVRHDRFNVYTDIDTTGLYPTSRLVSELTGFAVQPNKAIVGANAFRHESGIHQDGVLKMAQTYEIIDPRTVGVPSNTLVLGKLSGRHAFKQRLAELGYDLDDTALNRAFTAFKELADKKKHITDRDIESLVAEDQRTASEEQFRLERVQVTSGDRGMPTAAVRITMPDGTCLQGYQPHRGSAELAYRVLGQFRHRRHRRIRGGAHPYRERRRFLHGTRRRYGHHRLQRQGVHQRPQPAPRRQGRLTRLRVVDTRTTHVSGCTPSPSPGIIGYDPACPVPAVLYMRRGTT
jgi:2-isopropylmalate synthase